MDTVEISEFTKTYPLELDRAAISRLLPHRGQILLPTHISIPSKNHYVGSVHWSGDQLGIEGHFPGLPVVPAVYIVEGAAQVAGAGLMAEAPDARREAKIGMLAAIRKCSFLAPLSPGQVARYELRVLRNLGDFIGVGGEVSVAQKKVAVIDIVLALAPKDYVLKQMDHQRLGEDRETC